VLRRRDLVVVVLDRDADRLERLIVSKRRSVAASSAVIAK